MSKITHKDDVQRKIVLLRKELIEVFKNIKNHQQLDSLIQKNKEYIIGWRDLHKIFPLKNLLWNQVPKLAPSINLDISNNNNEGICYRDICDLLSYIISKRNNYVALNDSVIPKVSRTMDKKYWCKNYAKWLKKQQKPIPVVIKNNPPKKSENKKFRPEVIGFHLRRGGKRFK